MAESTSQTAVQPAAQDFKAEATFKHFTSEQAANYKIMRGSYSAGLYDFILDRHAKTGGATQSLVDIGCGPGNTTCDLAQFFDHVVGVDHSEGMLAAARQLGGTTKTGEPIVYRVGAAEELDHVEGIEPHSVDLISAGTAAHWFDMPRFWAAAAKILKPGGSVAIYTYSKAWLHPSIPNRDQIQEALDHINDGLLGPYQAPRNLLVRDHLKDLVLPWAPECPPPVAAAFDRPSFLYKIWDGDGNPEGGVFFGRNMELSAPAIQKWYDSASPYQRWKEANPALVGTDQDPIRAGMQKARELLGVPKGQENTFTYKAGMTTVLLMAKKAKE